MEENLNENDSISLTSNGVVRDISFYTQNDRDAPSSDEDDAPELPEVIKRDEVSDDLNDQTPYELVAEGLTEQTYSEGEDFGEFEGPTAQSEGIEESKLECSQNTTVETSIPLSSDDPGEELPLPPVSHASRIPPLTDGQCSAIATSTNQ
jgi:hypothetical protein